MRPRIALLAALALAGLACGNSREEKALDEAQAACLALTQPGTTLRDADIAMRGAQGVSQIACSPLVPLPGETCAPAEGDQPCEVFYYFVTTSVCSAQGGCCAICDVRMIQSDLSQHGVDALVCGSAFYRRQPC